MQCTSPRRLHTCITPLIIEIYTIEVSLKYIILDVLPDLYYNEINSARKLSLIGIKPETLGL